MNNISKELRQEIKDVLIKVNKTLEYNKNNEYDYKDISECFIDSVFEYCIITNDGTEYIINDYTDEIVDINLDDIIYVYKNLRMHSGKDYSNWDTVNGYYNDYNVFTDTLQKFNIVKTINDFID